MARGVRIFSDDYFLPNFNFIHSPAVVICFSILIDKMFSSYFGVINSTLDSFMRHTVNVVLIVVWVKIVVYKGYLSYKVNSANL